MYASASAIVDCFVREDLLLKPHASMHIPSVCYQSISFDCNSCNMGHNVLHIRGTLSGLLDRVSQPKM